MTDACPECNSSLARQEGCVRCPACGWAACADGGRAITREKLFEPDGNGPAERLVVVAYPDAEKADLYHERNTDDGWAQAGLLELHHGPRTPRGTFTGDAPVMLWSWTHFHAAGDRTRHDHRVRLVRYARDVELVHEERTEQVLGPADRRNTHDWRERDRWRVGDQGVIDDA